MTAAELRELSDAELDEKHDQFAKELFDLRFALVTGQLDDPTRLRRARRDIARVLTVQRQRALAAERTEQL